MSLNSSAGHTSSVINNIQLDRMQLTVERWEEKKSNMFIKSLKDNRCMQVGSVTIQPYRLFRQQKGFARSSVDRSNSEEWGWVAQKQASATIYCSDAPDGVIILFSVPQITLGPVPLSCIRFTTLYIHLLSRVNNDSALGNWINSTEIGK